MPHDGRLIACDVNAETTAIARRYWKRAGVGDKIELKLGPAVESLKKLKAGRRFDFAFIDAHKPEYDDYYELVLPLMRVNGLILFDNMLWGGRLGGKKPITHPHGRVIDGAMKSPRLIRHTPVPRTIRGPFLSISRPKIGLTTADARKPKENAPATRPRSQPNSSSSGGNSNENAVRAVTAIAIVTNAMPMTSQP